MTLGCRRRPCGVSYFQTFQKNNNNNNRISVKQSKMSTHMEIEFWSLKAGGEDRH